MTESEEDTSSLLFLQTLSPSVLRWTGGEENGDMSKPLFTSWLGLSLYSFVVVVIGYYCFFVISSWPSRFSVKKALNC